MKKKSPSKSDQFIVPLNMNGLRGRMLYMPSPPNKKRHILLIYGHHSSLERMFGVAEELNRYGSVTMPDLPGFGGMDTFYKIGEKPTLDNLADYLASFVKLKFKRKRITILGMSFGFLVVVRMLQRHPDLINKVDIVVSVVGFAHFEDFALKKRTFLTLRYGVSVLSNRIPALFAKHVFFRKVFIRAVYNLIARKNPKFIVVEDKDFSGLVRFEIKLWQQNDIRTQAETAVSMFKLDLCKQRLPLKLYHVHVAQDRYFDNHKVEQHLNVIFEKVTAMEMNVAGHAPTVIADAKAASVFIPTKLRRVLSR
jgi:pimeloyl-ACP methyl ester carboxylesterase